MTMKTIRLQETTERQSWMHDSVDKQQDQRALVRVRLGDHTLIILVAKFSRHYQALTLKVHG